MALAAARKREALNDALRMLPAIPTMLAMATELPQQAQDRQRLSCRRR
jgi:hypothetical protein